MSTRARIQLTIEIECHSAWRDDTKMEQIKKQAMDEALAKLQSLNVNIVGEKKFIAIIYCEDIK